LTKADLTDQFSKSGIAADRVEVRMGFDKLQDVRLLPAGLPKPVESLWKLLI
jgi:hypothetical protein